MRPIRSMRYSVLERPSPIPGTTSFEEYKRNSAAPLSRITSRATRAPLSTILEAGRTRLTRTMGTTIDRGIYLHSVSDNPAAAVRAGGRQRLNRTFKRIKCMRLAPDKNLKGLIVVVSAGFTNWHKVLLNLEEIGSVWSRALPEVCQLTRNRAAFVWSLELIFPSRGV